MGPAGSGDVGTTVYGATMSFAPPMTPPMRASAGREQPRSSVPLADAQWARIEPLFPDRTPHSRPGGALSAHPPVSHLGGHDGEAEAFVGG